MSICGYGQCDHALRTQIHMQTSSDLVLTRVSIKMKWMDGSEHKKKL